MKCSYCRENILVKRVVKIKSKATGKLIERLACEDCFLELTQDKITNQNINFFGIPGRKANDPSPWQENAVRHLEDERM